MITFLVYIIIWVLVGLSMLVDIPNHSEVYRFTIFVGMLILIPFIAYICGL